MVTLLQAAGAAAALPEGAEAAAQAPQTLGLGELILAGGWLMIPLFLLAGAMIFIFVERLRVIKRASNNDVNFMNKIKDLMYEGKIEVALKLCRNTNSPVARMVEKGIEHLGRPMNEIQSSIENVANLEVSKLERNLPFLATIAGGAPMIGFLGTVLGMVEAFMDMASVGGGINIQLLSSGMYTAMITTVGGLLVGIPAYFAYNYLIQKIETLVFQMEANTIAFLDILNHPVED